MKKLFTTFFMVVIGVITSFAQMYTVNITPNNPERGEVEIEEIGDEGVGKLPGAFSVSIEKKVRFSKGNLQYQASTDTWRFAEHQYDLIGIGYGETNSSDKNYVGGTIPNSDNRETFYSTYRGWIDFFGWGTGDNPMNSSSNTTSSDYPTFVDWGVNKISNGGNVANAWFTLHASEWEYLLYGRTNASSKQGVACVNGINGLVLLPDDWTLPSGAHFISGFANDKGFEYYKTVNIYTISEWEVMESAGAVFLPASGYRNVRRVSEVGYNGEYWSSTAFEPNCAIFMYFFSDEKSTYFDYRYLGRSVRLCSESQSTMINVEALPKYGYRFVSWSDGNTENPRVIAFMDNVDLEAEFDYDKFDIAAIAEQPQMGTVSGSGSYNYLSEQYVTATPLDARYRFVSWSDGNTENPRSITITQDETYTAIFEQTHAILAVNPSEKNAGTFDGPGLYEVGEKVFLQANPAPYYRFVKWSDGSTQNPRRITMTEDITLIAYFLDELAEESSVNSGQVLVEPDSTNAKFSWPQTDGTESYILEIKKEDVVFCTLEFNEYGQLAGIDFTTRAMTKGFQFKVTGLDEDSDYHFSLKAKDVSDNVIASYAGDFSTRAGSGSSVGESDLGKEEDNPSGGNGGEGTAVSENAHTVLVYGLDMHVIVQGAAAQTISVYNVAGQLLETRVAVSDKEVFDVYPEGVYIVNVGESTYKVVVK